MARWLNVSRRGWACVLPAAAIGLSRFWALGSDAPAWMPGAWLVDAGWWANGARGAVLFGDALSQDFGMAALMVPDTTGRCRLSSFRRILCGVRRWRRANVLALRWRR
ncbi:hypothetical protein HS125_08310 [bacterium]|nr:hypothetical protein [bacterium]